MKQTPPLRVGLGPSPATRAGERVSLAMHWGTRALAGGRPRATMKKRRPSRRARACPSPCTGAREPSRGTGPRATVDAACAHPLVGQDRQILPVRALASPNYRGAMPSGIRLSAKMARDRPAPYDYPACNKIRSTCSFAASRRASASCLSLIASDFRLITSCAMFS